MGLDTVEIVMAVEAEFGLKIPNSATETMLSVGDMHDYVVAALRQRGEPVDEADAWKRIVEIVVDQLGVKPGEVTPSAQFVRDLKAG